MSLNTKCSECGEWFPIGAKHSIGESCHRCKQKKAQFADEISATYPKTKCPVFGCTIPRGIPHEHPAGVSAVMRDPAAPLSADERAELEALRVLIQQNEAIKNFVVGLPHERLDNTGLQADGGPMIPGRKLRDLLLEAGQSAYEQNKAKSAIVCSELSRKVVLDLYGARDMQRPTGEKFVEVVFTPPPRRTLAQSVGKFMAWMFGIPALLLAAFAIGHYFGWWV